MRRMAILALLAACSAPAPDWQPAEGRDLIGRPAPAWAAGRRWFNSEPLTLEGLRGRVVFVRFWLIDCPYCSGSAPALNALHETFGPRGLTVIGFHHPKSARARDAEVVREVAREYGFAFPIALDYDWEALNKFWLFESRRFTSASFLIDKKGVIRWVHDGGTIEKDGPAYRSLEAEIERLLAEK